MSYDNRCQACGGTGSFQGRMSYGWPNCPECNGSGTTEPKVNLEDLLSQRYVEVVRQLSDAGATVSAQASALKMAREALIDAVAHLAGATSAYETYAGNVDRRSVRDALFHTRVKDFRDAIIRTRVQLVELDKQIAELAVK
jgi:hypothetical protein